MIQNDALMIPSVINEGLFQAKEHSLAQWWQVGCGYNSRPGPFMFFLYLDGLFVVTFSGPKMSMLLLIGDSQLSKNVYCHLSMCLGTAINCRLFHSVTLPSPRDSRAETGSDRMQVYGDRKNTVPACFTETFEFELYLEADTCSKSDNTGLQKKMVNCFFTWIMTLLHC